MGGFLGCTVQTHIYFSAPSTLIDICASDIEKTKNTESIGFQPTFALDPFQEM